MYLKRRILNRFLSTWMITTLVIILLLPIIIGIALYLRANPLLEAQSFKQLILSNNWSPEKGHFGFLPFILSSLYVTILAFLFAAPVSLFSAVYLTQFSSKRLLKIMQPVIDILAGIPSVVYGVWGILVIVPFTAELSRIFFHVDSTGYSTLSGGIVLAIMCIPYMLNMLIETFQTVPIGLQEASLSLGATQWEAVKHTVIKKSVPGIISSFGLGMAKAFGETMAVMMVVGNVVHLSINPLKPSYPLPALIANNFGEMMSIPMYDSALMFAAFILFAVILCINLIFRYFIHKTQAK
jgi:phosphate transport system permease protein